MRRFACAAALALLLASPAVSGTCPRATGDVAPGVLLAGAPVPRWSPEGDGAVNIADVVVSLREAVGLQVAGGPLVGGDCASLPSDLAPGDLDTSTAPPTFTPRGDGLVDIADVVVQLRASIGLVQLAPLPARSSAKLTDASGCDELLLRLRESAKRQFDETGSWGGGWWWGRWGGGDVLLDGAEAGGPMPAAGGAAPGSFSETNVQVGGVDEPDLVKTDGSIAVAISGQSLHVLRAAPVTELALLSSVPVSGWPTGLLLDRGHAIVISQDWGEPILADATSPLAGFAAPQGSTRLQVFDLANPAAPRLAREVIVAGWLQASRLIDGRSVLVMYHGLNGPPMPPWQEDQDAWRAAVHAAIDASTLEDWLPELVDARHAADGTTSILRRFAVSCDDVSLPADVPPAGLVNVLELDAVVPGPIGGAAIVGTASTVFVGREQLIVGMDDWRGAMMTGGDVTTRLHAFALGGADGEPRYLGAGEVPGWVSSPWSLDLAGSQLRAVTTMRNASWQPSTGVFVLQPNGTGDYELTGSVTGLAPGETLQAARYDKDRAYLVTFERKDPLFVIDLSDAAHPSVAGELEITGWSSYLHPLGEDHLIGIGREVDPDTQVQLGMQVSLFDVSNPAAPSLADRHVEPTGWNGSEAEWDHHAFTYFEPLSMLAVPLVSWELHDCGDCDAEPWWDWSNRLVFYSVTAAPTPEVAPAGALNFPFEGCSPVRRSVFIGDSIIAFGDGGAAGARVAAPGTILSLVEYPGAPDCGDGIVVGGDPGTGAGGSEPGGVPGG